VGHPALGKEETGVVTALVDSGAPTGRPLQRPHTIPSAVRALAAYTASRSQRRQQPAYRPGTSFRIFETSVRGWASPENAPPSLGCFDDMQNPPAS